MALIMKILELRNLKLYGRQESNVKFVQIFSAEMIHITCDIFA